MAPARAGWIISGCRMGGNHVNRLTLIVGVVVALFSFCAASVLAQPLTVVVVDENGKGDR
jgi:hypothetical protein